MKKTSLLLASITLALSGVAQANQLEDIQKSGTLRVGTTGDYKPFSYFDGKT
ncbi:cyclohexadienyl dehydratase, partial [Vibrio sp. 10N.286.49.E1]